MAPLLLRMEGLTSSGDGAQGVPREFLQALEVPAAVQTFRMRILQERLHELTGACESAGIPVLLLKGAAMGRQYLGGLASRPMGDVDLLVHPQDAQVVHRMALESGRWKLPGRGLHAALYRDMHHLIPLDAADGIGFGLEVHTELFPEWHPFAFGATDVWREARLSPPRDGGPGVLVPSADHLLLHACIHFGWSHCFARGTWKLLRDVDALLEAGEIDPERFVALAVSARAGSACWWTLTLFESLSGRSLPAAWLTGLEPFVPRLGRRTLLRHLSFEATRRVEDAGTLRLRKLLWERAMLPGRNGHGASRPWVSSERWPDREDPFGEEGRTPTPLGRRIAGLARHLGRIATGRGRDPGDQY